MQSVNPFNGEVVAEYQEYSWDDVDGRLVAAHRAFLDWRRGPFSERAAVLRAAAKRLEARKDEFARLMAIEMGKPVAAGRAEVEKCAWVCNYYADEAEGMLADVVIPTDRTKSYLHHEPLGVVLAVMPWNFPFWQVFRFLAPGLMAGNAGVLKHSSNVSGCALAIEEVMVESGIPDGLFSTLLIGSSMVNRVFHDAYRSALSEARLTADASEALATVASGGHTQSLLSMFPHQDLIPLVERIGISGFFDRIDGLMSGRPGDLKAGYLEVHLRNLIVGEDPRSVVVIGDTPDDAIAASHVGARPILYDGGSHHRLDLEATGAEVASTLMAAVEMALDSPKPQASSPKPRPPASL